MQGFYFLFSVWTIILLYIRKNEKRKDKFFILCVLFFLIICSTFTIELFSIQINIAYILLIFVMSYFISFLKNLDQLLIFFKGLIIGMAYSSMSMIAIYDPASFFVNEFYSIILINIVLVLFLSKHYLEQLRLTVIGLLQGEVFNFFTYKSIQIQYVIGGIGWLDYLFLTILVLSTIKLLAIYFSKKKIKSRGLVKN